MSLKNGTKVPSARLFLGEQFTNFNSFVVTCGHQG